MPTYAQNTQVSTDRSLSEIKSTLMRYGADQFAVMESRDSASVAFTYSARHVRFDLAMPRRDDEAFTRTPTGKARVASAAESEWEKACRQRWRALALVVKAKLEAVEAGISTFDQEFFAHLVLPGGKSVFEQVAPAVAKAIEGDPAPLLQITGGEKQ